MSESVPVRCPACRREHEYAAPPYPCACGAPVAPTLNRRAEPVAVTCRSWDDDWVTVRCGACGRLDQWPYPELGCPCGTMLRIPVGEAAPPESGPGPDSGPGAGPTAQPPPGKATTSPALRRAFRPLPIRSARDAVTATALYLRWLGFRDIRRADQRQPSGISLAARGLLCQVEPTVRPTSLRDVECLWLTAMTESADCVCFTLSGYSEEARSGADSLGVPLFVLDLTGTPRPVNDPARRLARSGAP